MEYPMGFEIHFWTLAVHAAFNIITAAECSWIGEGLVFCFHAVHFYKSAGTIAFTFLLKKPQIQKVQRNYKPIQHFSAEL